MKKLIIAIVMVALLPAAGIAVERPSSQEAKKVIDYYAQGKGNGAVIVDAVFCTKMGTEGDYKNDCVESISTNEIKVGDEVYLWMNFMVPANDTADIFLSYSRNQRIRNTQKIHLKNAFRFRTWKKIVTNKPGKWTIQIYQEVGDEDLDLGILTYNVVE